MSDISLDNNTKPGLIQKYCSCFRGKAINLVFPFGQNKLLENSQNLYIQDKFQQHQLFQMKLQIKKPKEKLTQNFNDTEKIIISQNRVQVDQQQMVISNESIQNNQFQNHSQQLQIMNFRQSFQYLDNNQQENKSQINLEVIQHQFLQSQEKIKISDQYVEFLKNELEISKQMIKQFQEENQNLKEEIIGLKYHHDYLQELELFKFTSEDKLIIQNILVEEIQKNFDLNQFLIRINQNNKFSQLQNEEIIRNIEILEDQFLVYRNKKLQEFIEKSQELEILILNSLSEIQPKTCDSSQIFDDLQFQYKQLETFFKEKQQFLENQKIFTFGGKLMMERYQDKIEALQTQSKQEDLQNLDYYQQFSNKEYEDLIAQRLLLKDKIEEGSQISKINDISDYNNNFQNNKNLRTSAIKKSYNNSQMQEISRKNISNDICHEISECFSCGQLSQSQNISSSMRSIRNQYCKRCQCLIEGPIIQTNCFHCYHQECFDEMLEQQIFIQKITEIQCFCKYKFDQKIFVQVSQSKQELLKNQLYQNQLNAIKLQPQNQKLIVECSNKNCNFFFINPIGKQVESFKCFECSN